MQSWLDEDEAALTICDLDGVIVYMNERSRRAFEKYEANGSMIGTSLIECHPEPARSKLLAMLAAPMTNIYTVEKKGVKKIIRQSPWMVDGVFSGVVEISFEIPQELPHHIRD